MSKLYVPEGVWLACDKGTSPSTLRVSHNVNTTIYSQPMATEADKLPFFNIKPMGLCSTKLFSGCLPAILKWDKPKDGVKINGNRMLLKDSTCQCGLGGKVTIHFDRASAVEYGLGEGKMPTDYIKEGFDWMAKNAKKNRADRDSWLPDWMKPIAHVGDWFEDLGVGLVEGAANGIVGLGELAYQIGQDPVGMAEGIGGMISDGYSAAKDGLGKAWNWAQDGDNWKNSAEGAWNWVSDSQNWKNTVSNTWEGTKDAAAWVAKNPRKIGNTLGEVAPDVVAAVYTGGSSLAASASKKALKEGGELVVKNVVEEVGEQATKKIVKETGEAVAKKTAQETLEALAKKEAGNIAKVVTKEADNLAEIAMKQLDDLTENLTNTIKKCLNDPVDPVTGNVLYPYTDFELPGPIPIQWKREYNSASKYRGLLGYGVSSVFDLHLSVLDGKEKIKINLADGDIAYFTHPKEGETRYHVQAKLRLTLENNTFYLFDYKNRWLYTYQEQENGQFKPIKIEDGKGFTIQLIYANNKLYQIIDSRKQTLDISSDYRGNIIRVGLSTPTETRILVEYEYDLEGNMIAVSDSLKQKTTIEYDRNHRMIKKTDRNGQSFYWEYNHSGKCIHTWGDGGLQEGFFEYQPGKTLYKDSTNITQTYYYDERCRITREEDAFGNSKFYEYDEKDNLIKETDEEGLETLHAYDKLGNLIKTTLPDESTYTFVYDEESRLILATDPSGNHTLWNYHKNKLISTESDGKSTHFLYNEQNLISTIRNHWEEETHLQYDSQYNLVEMTNPLKQTTRWKYNALGECTEVINPLGKKQQFEYDRLGRLAKVQLPNTEIIDLKYDAYDSLMQVNSLHSKINYTYTPLGSILSREEKGIKVFFEYDVQERLTALSNEKGEKYQFSRNQRGDIVREVSFDGISRYYNRDKAGKVVRIKRGADRFTEYEYDKGGRITRAEYHDGSWETFSYDQAGRLIEARNSKISVSFKRNREGKILQEKQGEHLLDYLYDKDGNLIEVQSSLGAKINYTRDTFGQITGIQVGGEENPWIAKIKRNMLGLEVERTLPGGVKSSWSYDENNQPLSQKVETLKHKTGLHKNYRWNASQQLHQITNALTKGETIFAYDAFGSLASARYEDGSYDYKLPDEIGNLFRDSAKEDRKYGKGGKLIQDRDQYLHYDAEGNLILKTKRKNPAREAAEAPASKISFWIDSEEERVTPGFWINEEDSKNPVYDNLFDERAEIRSYSKKEREEYNRLRGRDEQGKPKEPEWQLGDWGYEWLANGMLKTVTTPEGKKIRFEYDALGRRTAKIAGDKIYRYLWDGNVLLHEWNYPLGRRPQLVANSEGKIYYNQPEPIENLVSWIYEDGALVPTGRIEQGKTHSIISDYIGQPIQVYNEEGECVWETEYDIYGNLRNLKGNRELIPFRQLGQYEDVETGLFYNRFRYYSPETGMYISQDPIGLAGNNPNLYAYVHDSNTMVDPLGLMPQPEGTPFKIDGNGRWHDSKGKFTSFRYPPNNGFEGASKNISLSNTTVDRYGGWIKSGIFNDGGRFLGNAGDSFEARALPPLKDGTIVSKYKIKTPFDVESGKIAPWFGQPGGGTQYFTGSKTIGELIESENLELIERKIVRIDKNGKVTYELLKCK